MKQHNPDLDKLKYKYKDTFFACLSIMKKNKGSRVFREIPFADIYDCLEMGYKEEHLIPFLENATLFKHFRSGMYDHFLENPKLLNAMKECEMPYESKNIFYWKYTETPCTLEILTETLKYCSLFKEDIDGIESLKREDYDMIHRIYKRFTEEVINVEKYTHHGSNALVRYCALFKKRGLDYRLIDGYVKYLKDEHIEIHALVLKQYPSQYVEILEMCERYPEIFDFHSAAICKLTDCPILEDINEYQAFQTRTSIRSIYEIYYSYTKKALTPTQLFNNVERFINYSSSKSESEQEKDVLVAMICSQGTLFDYLDLQLTDKEYHTLIASLIDYKLAFKECMEKKFISLRHFELEDLRKRIIKNGRN